MKAWRIILTKEEASLVAWKQYQELVSGQHGDSNLRRLAIYLKRVECLESPLTGERLLDLKPFSLKSLAKEYIERHFFGYGVIEGIELPGVGYAKIFYGRVHL